MAYEAETAFDAVPNNEPVIPCVTISDPLNIAGPMLVKVEEPDTVNDPVITADPLYGNGEIYPSRYDAVNAYEALTAFEAVPCKLPVNDPENEPVNAPLVGIGPTGPWGPGVATATTFVTG